MRSGRFDLALVVVVSAACACAPPADEAAAGPAVVRVAVSESTLPLLERVADSARTAVPGIVVEFLPSMHSAGAVAATHLGNADLGVVSRPLTDSERGFGLRYIHVARDPVVVAVHRGVPVVELTVPEIRAIYSGVIANWRFVGGPDLPIVVLDRGEHTSPKRAMRAGLLRDLEITTGAMVLERPGMMTESLETIEGSIGFTTLGQMLATTVDATIIAIDGERPTAGNVASGRYPWTVPVGLVLPPTPARDPMRFVEYLIGDAARPTMEELGYGPILVSLVIGTVPEQNVLRQEERFRPLARHLSVALGSKAEVRLRHLESYDDVVREFAGGGVNAAFLGSYTYAVAHRRLGVVPLVRPEIDGVSRYRGLILVRRDGGVRDWSELRGKRFAMVEDTTAAELFPRLYLRRHGAGRSEDFLGGIEYAPSHEAAVRLLLAGEVDAAAAKDLIFERMVREDATIAERVEVLARSSAVPENALVVRHDLDVACLACHGKTRGVGDAATAPTDVAELMRRELLALEGDPAGRSILAEIGADRFVETRDEDYAPVYSMIDELGDDLDALREASR